MDDGITFTASRSQRTDVVLLRTCAYITKAVRNSVGYGGGWSSVTRYTPDSRVSLASQNPRV
jgi:hypothetical protein